MGVRQERWGAATILEIEAMSPNRQNPLAHLDPQSPLRLES